MFDVLVTQSIITTGQGIWLNSNKGQVQRKGHHLKVDHLEEFGYFYLLKMLFSLTIYSYLPITWKKPPKGWQWPLLPQPITAIFQVILLPNISLMHS